MDNVSKRIVALVLVLTAVIAGCKKADVPQAPSPEPDALSRTEFTQRIENYFEYEPLHSGKASPVRIHLTDLASRGQGVALRVPEAKAAAEMGAEAGAGGCDRRVLAPVGPDRCSRARCSTGSACDADARTAQSHEA